MNEYPYNNQEGDRPEPWEQPYYETGNTCPPKRCAGWFILLLAAVVLIGGIVSGLGLFNIHLLRQPAADNQEDGASVGFSQEQATTQDSASQTDETKPVNPDTNADTTLEISATPQSVENIPQAGGLSLQAIYEKSISSVVSICCTGHNGTSTGTGVVLSENGYLVTNHHVIENAQKIEVLFSDDRILNAVCVGSDGVSDLAVLYIESDTPLTPAEFGDSTALRVGDAVVAIGDPLGIELRGTMTNGIVSAINRDITSGGRTMTLIQTNAALNSGNSGGPLLNCYGQVVGINTMKIGDNMSTAGVEGLGFAIPSTTVKEIVDQLIAQGYVSGRPSLGITGQVVSGFDQLYYRLPQGIYITQVEEDSDAAAKGIAPGDILLQLQNTRITDTDALQSALYAYEAGDTVTVIIYRSGRQYSLDITLGQSQ